MIHPRLAQDNSGEPEPQRRRKRVPWFYLLVGLACFVLPFFICVGGVVSYDVKESMMPPTPTPVLLTVYQAQQTAIANPTPDPASEYREPPFDPSTLTLPLFIGGLPLLGVVLLCLRYYFRPRYNPHLHEPVHGSADWSSLEEARRLFGGRSEL